MRDEDKTKAQLINELIEQRQLNADLIQANKSIKHILATLVEKMSEGIIVTDFNGQIIYVNKSTEEYSGYSRHELIGRSPMILNGEQDAETIWQEIAATMQRSERWCREILQKRKDGNIYLAELEIFPVLDDECTPLAWASIQRDITNRRQMENALRVSEIKYRTLVEQIPAIIYIAALDETRTTLYVNPQIEKLLGFSQSEYLANPGIWSKKIHLDDRERVLADLFQCHTYNENYISEYRMFTRDGRVLWFRDEAEVVRDETRQPLYLHGIMFDITERKQIEQKFQESEARLRRITDNMLDMICQTNTEGIIEYISPSHKSILGYEPEDVLGMSIFDLVHPDDRVRVITAMQSAIDSVLSGKIEYRYSHADGHYLWLESVGNLLYDDNSRIVGAIFSTRDINERKQAEVRLQESEERYRQLVELSPCAICIYSEGKVVYINKFGAKLFGVENPDDLIGKPVMDFVHPDYRQIVRERVQKMMEEGESAPLIEEKFILPNGTVLDVQVAATTLIYQGKPAIQAVILDITKRKRAEKELSLSKDRFYKAFNASPNPMAINKLDGTYVDINNSFTQVVGYRPDEVIGFTPKDLNIFESTKVLVKVLQILQDQGSIRNYEAYIRTKSGDLRFGLFSADIIDIKYDKYLLTIFTDITERKQIEEELCRREQFLNSIFESIQDSLTIIDTEFNIIRTNKRTEQRHTHEQPLVGKKCYQTYYGKDKICDDCPSLITIRDCEPAHAIIPAGYTSGQDNGWLEHYAYPFIDTATGKLTGVIIYVRDVTEKLRMEQELAHMERLHLVGQMAAGIGHEIRNPMTTVRGLLQLLGPKKEFAHYKGYFELMISELDRANSIITEYLSLTRNKPDKLVELDLNTILAELQPLLLAEAMDAGKNLLIEQGDIPKLLLNENEIRQLILNLVKNGFEAMEHGGKLTVQTYTDNDEVVLSVKDQGPGISADLLKKLGTPFLTTKDNGTGLGLAVCYGITKRHNAAITIDTGPEGTAFFVRFKFKN